MQQILVLGAGRSASSLIEYLLAQAATHQWQVIVADLDVQLAQSKVQNHPHGSAVAFDFANAEQAHAQMASAALVISMLPPRLHAQVAQLCLQHQCHLITASYVSADMQALAADFEKRGLLCLMECGLDPGIDHMTSMKAINHILAQNGSITAFKSYTGGLVAPQSDNNPWGYKITWNPRNVVLAGQGTATFVVQNRLKYVPYHHLFTQLEKIQVDPFGSFEGYPNRDSLSYRSLYQLENIPTFIRGTLRRPGYAQAWHVLVRLGLTDASFKIENPGELTYRQFTNSFLPYHPTQSVEEKLCRQESIQPNSGVFERLQWLGLFEDVPLQLKPQHQQSASPADVLQNLIEAKWALDVNDTDMIVMQHQVSYTLNGQEHLLVSSMTSLGHDQRHTAMSRTVGLPLGIAACLLFQGKIKARGLQIPIQPEFYEPIIESLGQQGIHFTEHDTLQPSAQVPTA